MTSPALARRWQGPSLIQHQAKTLEFGASDTRPGLSRGCLGTKIPPAPHAPLPGGWRPFATTISRTGYPLGGSLRLSSARLRCARSLWITLYRNTPNFSINPVFPPPELRSGSGGQSLPRTRLRCGLPAGLDRVSTEFGKEGTTPPSDRHRRVVSDEDPQNTDEGESDRARRSC